jgi:hydroxyethylthiazole kinase-like sugar kinase family protein
MKGRPMNKNIKLCISIVAAGICVAAVTDSILARLESRKTDAKINAKLQYDLKALKVASQIVRQKIQNGDYENRSSADIESDFEFYKIAFYEM